MTRKVKVRDLEVAVDEAGSGPPVVLVHGFPFARAMWAPMAFGADGLAERYRVVTYDLRHHGETGGEDRATRMEDFADDLLALMDALQMTQAIVGGLSMGGYLLLHAYGKAPERFAGLLLFDTRPTPDTEEARKGRFATAERVRREGPGPFTEEFLSKVVAERTLAEKPDVVEGVRAMMRQATAGGIARTLEALAGRPSYVDVLPKVEVPTLVVVGEEDAITPPEQARAMVAAIPGAEYVVVPDAGHLAPFERPDVVRPAVLRHLRGN